METKYFECHITIEPVFDERLIEVQNISRKHSFKVADLLMMRRKNDTPVRSSKDTFTTSTSSSYEEIYERMNACVLELIQNDFKVWRKKIEAVVFDERISREKTF